MTPSAFIKKWEAANLKERSASQEHFIDLCRLLGEPTPAEADPEGEWYCFERGASKLAEGEGWADVWKRGHFGWEYKGKRKDLRAAYVQLQQYSVALENPLLLVVCDMDTAVAEAYGWKPDMPDDEILSKLLTLNLERTNGKQQE